MPTSEAIDPDTEEVEQTEDVESADDVQPVPESEQQWYAIGNTGIEVAQATLDATDRRVQEAPADPTVVTVTILSAKERAALGLTGLALMVERADGLSSVAPIEIRIPEALVADVYGADYGGRVTWRVIPGLRGKPKASLTGLAPESGEVESSIDPASGATVLSPSISGAQVIMAATSSATSATGTGTFGASDLKPSSSWDVSAQTGGFSWTYPMSVPPAPAGPTPSLNLSYNSQAVDGATGSTNNQPSVVGEGWSLGATGFIERTYVSCSIDDGSSGAVTTSGDLCWKTDNATISLAGHSGPIIRDSTTGIWKLENDDGSRIERLTGTGQGCAANGTYNTECWRLTTTDGTQYFFGLNQLPGWSSGKPTTNSAWAVPVYGNDAGEPCHAGTFAASSCMQGWRWNLDYVVDVHGNAETFYYHAETNKYAAGGSGAASYTRGGSLDRIEYGLKAGSLFVTNAATAKVVFGYDTHGRCNDPVRTNCTTQPLDGLATTPASPAKYPDVPFDQNCTGSSCSTMLSPTFWSVAQLNTVITKVLSGGSYTNVDVWTLGHSFPDPGDGTSAALWMTQVGHTGYTGGTSITEADVIFSGITMQNRVWAIDGLAPLDKYRISSVRLESGGVISVNYSAQDCAVAEVAAILADVQNNHRRCFPQWWSPDIVPPQAAQLDLFHKYVVTSTVANPMTGGGSDQPLETYYDYSAGSPAWRYNSSPFTTADRRTWSEYAGYDRVTIRVGSPSSPTTQQTSQYTFFQGMDGDRAAPAGGTKSVNVAGTVTVTDSLWLAGRTYQVKVLNGAAGAVVSTTTTLPWVSGVKANDGYRTSRIVRDASVTVAEPLSTGSTRTISTHTTYESTYGLPLTVSQNNEASAVSTCTTTTYAPTNTSVWLIGSPQEIVTVGKKCTDLTSAVYPTDSISWARYAYDGQAVGAAPIKGTSTQTLTVDYFTSTTAGSAHWVVSSTTQYDSMGRVTMVTDALGRTITTAYTPAASAPIGSGPTTASSITNTAPFSWVTTMAVDPARGNVTSITDQNGKITSATYDALGRTSKVWTTDHTKAAFPNSPTTSFVYSVLTTGASSVATTSLVASGSVTSYVLYDGLGRQVQTQTVAEGGGAVISDTEFDTAGRTSATNSAYWTASVSPSGTLFVPTSLSQIPSRSQISFDGLGRALVAALVSFGVELSRATNSYLGVDRTDLTPPTGSTPTTTIVNSLGQQTQLVQYLSATVDPLATQIATQYTYDAQGHTATMKDAANNVWSWTYDVLGRNTQIVSPDAGTSTLTYDLLGNVLTSTDARGSVIANVYDALNRKIQQRETSTTGALLASWVYDTIPNAKGQLTSSSSYTGSVPGTPGLAYTTAVTAYDAAYRPTATTTTIPAGAPAFGGTNYSQQLSYYQDGSPNVLKVPAIGGLPAESIRSTYNGNGRLGGVRSALTNYAAVGYTPIGQQSYIERTGLVSSSTSYGYDQATGLMLHILETTLTGSTFTPTADRTYGRDASGNVVSIATTASGVANDTQCFTYDYLQNLTAAWTPTSASCATAPTSSTLGGPAPYWTTYEVDPITGNREATVAKPISAGGNATTYDYNYPAAAAPRPHAASGITQQVGSGTPTTTSYGYDASGNTTTRPGQTLDYNALGKLTKVTIGSNTQKNIYDADGNLLIRVDSVAGATLFVGSTELKTAAGSSVVTGVRTYSANGTPVAERTSIAGMADTVLNWLSADFAGTGLMRINAVTATIVRRYMDPFGAPRGTVPPWSSDHAFLNAPSSATTALTHLGAREYDPALGRFTTVDPVLVLTNPQQNNGYSYSANNPATSSDPSGLLCTTCEGTSKGKSGTLAKPTSAPPASAGDGGGGSDGDGDSLWEDLQDQWDQWEADFDKWTKSGEAGFDFENGVYTTRPDAKQLLGGYHDFYDLVFRIFVDPDLEKYEFTYDNQTYVFWVWKGYYLNMGGGAEVGFYEEIAPGIWKTVGNDDAPDMSVTLSDSSGVIASHDPDVPMSWVGLWAQEEQDTSVELTANYTVNFPNHDMYLAFQGRDLGGEDDPWQYNSETSTATLKFRRKKRGAA